MTNANKKFEIHGNEELVTTVDITSRLKELIGHPGCSGLAKLAEFSAARRKLEEFSGLIDPTELNVFLRLAFDGEDPTIDAKDGIRDLDFRQERDEKTGLIEVQPSKKHGLSFCSSLKQLADVVTRRIPALNKKKRKQAKSPFFNSQEILNEVKVFIFNGGSLPEGLAFVEDKPGHVLLGVTRRMLTVELIKKLEVVGTMLEYLMTLKVES